MEGCVTKKVQRYIYAQVWKYPPNRQPPRVVQYILSSQGLFRNNLNKLRLLKTLTISKD